MTITKPQAMRAGSFQSKTIYSRARKPELVSVRANGRCKTWKREPDRFCVPVKYGLRECFYITNQNAHKWTCGVPEMVPFDPKWRTRDVLDITKAIVAWEIPPFTMDQAERAKLFAEQNAAILALADALEEAGADQVRIGEAKKGQPYAIGALLQEIQG